MCRIMDSREWQKQEQSTDNQLPELQEYAGVKGYEIAELYKEEASAWRNGHQKELSRLLSDIRLGKRHYDVYWSGR